MSLTLNLPAELESELDAEAARFGLPLAEYIVRVLTQARTSTPRTGADLLAYWQKEGLIGTRTDVADSPVHARALREQTQRRERP